MAVEVFCYKCEVKMQKERSGLKIKLPNNYCQHGDLFKCPICGVEVVSDLGKPHPDEFHTTFEFELKRWDEEKERLQRLKEWAEKP